MPEKIALLILSFFLVGKAGAQLAPNPYAGAVYYYDFGQGNEDPATIGQPLAVDRTDFKFTTDLCPLSGYYTVARHVNTKNCFADSWITIETDHTPYGAGLGMGMIFKTDTHFPSRIVYQDTINKSLCVGQTYEFSAAILNLIKQSFCPSFQNSPLFRLQVEADDGTIITSGDFAVPSFYDKPPYNNPPWWRAGGYSVDFTITSNVKRVVIKVILIRSYIDCADAFALDDIAVTTIGPQVAVQLKNEPATLIKSVCFQNNEAISMSGSMDPFYANPALQWQQSTDSGRTWGDIPGATASIYTRTFSVPDTFFFRLSGGNASLIANPACRVFSGNIEVNVDGLPSGYTITTNSPVCSGHDIKFNVNGDEAGYVWTGPNGFYDDSPFPHIYQSKLADSGTYYVQIFSQSGCSKADSTNIVVIGTDVYATPIDTAICSGESVKLNASKGIKYEWDPVNNLSAPNIFNPVAIPSQTTRYVVTVYDQSGCSDTAGVAVIVKNKIPVKAQIVSPEFLCRPSDSASFKDISLGQIASWNWDFGNGMKSIEQNPPIENYFIETNATGYTVQLIVADSAGCADTASHILKVENNCYIAVPNAFTPNGDGLNDYLYPLNAYKATDLQFSVYSRYGQLVFKTTDWTKKWDGTKNGEAMPGDVYVWTLNYNDASGKRVSLKGSTLLIR